MAKQPLSSDKILEDFFKLTLDEQINLFKAIKLVMDKKREATAADLKSLQEIEK